MKYNFVDLPNRRNVGAGKWEGMLEKNPNIDENIIPFSVADMEFNNAPELVEGLKKYLDEPIYGYTGPTQKYYDAIINYMDKYHDWKVEKDWIVEIGGVVPALFHLVSSLTNKGDGVIILNPVYYPFSLAIEKTQRKIENVSLIENEGKYTIDFEELERVAKLKTTTCMILCNPHNPIGRVWSKEELERIGDICVENHVILISDDIHFDFIMDGYKHTVISTLSNEIANNTVVCTAPSKSFNLGGVQVSNIMIPNDELRNKFKNHLSNNAIWGINTFAYKTCEIVYNECREWLDELLIVLNENKKIVEDYIKENLPMIKVCPLEGTYLMWLDCRALNLEHDELEKLMVENDLYFDEGYIFGDEGKGFERINIACPSKYLINGLERFKNAVNSLQKK